MIGLSPLDALRGQISTLQARLDSPEFDGVRYSFAALYDSIDSKQLEEAVYNWGIAHLRRAEAAEATIAALRSENDELRKALLTRVDSQRD